MEPGVRYELAATTNVRSGRSADPLSQAPVPTINVLQQTAQARGRQEMLGTTDTLGERPSASPVVNPNGKRTQGLGRTRFRFTLLLSPFHPRFPSCAPPVEFHVEGARPDLRNEQKSGRYVRMPFACGQLKSTIYFCNLTAPPPIPSFSDWRPTSSRARQPPGGQSSMSQIFG
jgi:hypothetical protein